MKKIKFLIPTLLLIAVAPLAARDLSDDIPNIQTKGFEKVEDVAHYKNADWDNVVGIARKIPLPHALRIAEKNPEITYLFYTKGKQMVLETTDGDYRLFHRGDAVFFSGTPAWGTAPGLADGYIKTAQ